MTAGLIIAATGLKREARILGGARIGSIAGGGDHARLEAAVEAAAPTARGIISIGLGGALAAGLKPGDWVVGYGVVLQQGRVPTDPDWTERLCDRLAPARTGEILGSDLMVADAATKHRLQISTGAIAVDMESHIAGRVAARHGLPFAIARVISDGADRALPNSAQAGMKPDGGMDVLAVLKALLRRPVELPALIRTALEAETAFRALVDGRQRLGLALLGPDLS